jgi:LysR family glycine cleavage system transcriptional activator
MSSRDYPLNALRCFEASARHLSFLIAAQELHVTPAAVSHQVKKLEEYLGAQLFQRLPRGVVLAEAGQVLLPEVRDGFLRLDRAIERVRGSDQAGALTISVAPIFAVKWLVPRLGRFGEAHPRIDVRVSSSLAVVDFRREGFDAAVRLGKGSYEGVTSVKLFEESVTPMCSPRLLRGPRRLRSPGELSRHVLLHDDSVAFDPAAPRWTTWLNAARAAGVDAARGPRFGQPDHALQAAIAGARVVVGWYFFWGD